MADALASLKEGLERGLSEIVELHGVELDAAIDEGDLESVREIGRRAAALAASSLLWQHRVGGQLVDTAWVCEHLNVTRQAVAKKVATGQLIALPGGRSRQYPTWQFTAAIDTPALVLADVPRIIAAFREVYPDTTPVQIAAWANKVQPELEGRTPADWIDTGQPPEPLVLAARRAAAALAQ